MTSAPTNEKFADNIEQYLHNAEQANSEAALGHHFLTFIQNTFSTLNSAKADQLLPFLEEHVSTDSDATIAINGRIDARLGNVIIEFKTDLESDLGQAKEQLRDYITAIWENQGRNHNYYLVASDGVLCKVYAASLNGESIDPDNVDLEEVDEIFLKNDDTDWVYTQLDRYLLYSENIDPAADAIVRDFGPNSPVHRECMELLEENWEDTAETGAAVLFDEWKRYLEIVHGTEQSQSDALFLRHTYLSTLAKLMAFIQYSGGHLPNQKQIRPAITGELFKSRGIQNFIEEDFFTWISRPAADGVDQRLAEIILARLGDYNLQSIKEDVLKELYQNLVTQEERHNLGEYYTPDWLVEEIVQEELGEDVTSSVLDPTCGSGTFLFRTIHYKRENSGLEGENLLNHIEENVVGIDVHPLALIIARVNYILALGDLLRDARTGEFSVPVYLSNTVMPPTHELSGEGVEVYRFQSDEATFEIPTSVTGDDKEDDSEQGEDYLNEVMDATNDYINSADTLTEAPYHASVRQRVGDTYSELNDEERGIIYNRIATPIKKLKEDGRDTIWTFILKNVYKPIYLENSRFELVLGNPPWLPYRDISRERYEQHIRDLVIEHYEILSSDDVENITHIELAALFFVYCTDKFLDDGGRISFVLPRGFVNGDHLDRFRRVEYTTNLRLTYMWDLRDVRPLFNNQTAVLAAEKSSESDGFTDSYPLDGRRYRGRLAYVNAPPKEALEELDIEESTFYLNILGERSVIMDRELDPELFNAQSPYEPEVNQGATVVPRTLWFVDIDTDDALGINPQEPLVRSSERALSRAGDGWDVEMHGQIEHQFLYHCITGSEMTHFTTRDYPTAVLPLQISGNNYNLLDENTARSNGLRHLANWISEASELWENNKEESNDDTVIEYLDHWGKLQNQDPNPRYRVLQNSGGSYVTGAVVDTHDLEDIKVNGTTIDLARNNDGYIPLVVDHKCYYYETDDEGEAYFLSGFLNAPLILELIEEMMTQGLFGGRDIHKLVWSIAIPKYDPEDETHRRIRDLAMEGEERAEEMLPELEEKYSLGYIRKRQREAMEELRNDLSELCLDALEEAGTSQSSVDQWNSE